MNGRIYDYNLGRFMSVDPFIQMPESSQSINPYSYLMNNPMAGTDPTGYIAQGTNASNWRDNCFDAHGCLSTPVDRALSTYTSSGGNNNSLSLNAQKALDEMNKGFAAVEQAWNVFANTFGQVNIVDLPAGGGTNTTPEQRAEIEKKLVALNTEITEINKSGGFTSEESAAAWYHEKVHPIGVTYDTEFGAKMFKNLIWNGETLVDKFFLGNVVTQHYSNQVQLSGSQFGSLNAVSKWHTHGNSNVGHTVGADTDWADASKSRSAYVSRGPTYRGSGISLDVWQNGGATTICGVKCNF
jgi:hypothetical protein